MAKHLVIFGGSGRLGHELVEAFSPTYHVSAPARNVVDITDRLSVEKYIQETKPDIVINAAGDVNVEAGDRDPIHSFAVNAHGAHHIALATHIHHIPMVQISTDYVFDGTKESGFLETDQTNPVNIYGASKDAGERLVRIANPAHWVVRTSALFGTSGANFVNRMLARANEGADLKVVVDQWTVPTFMPDFARGLDEMIHREIPYGTYHLTNDRSATWHEFAVEVMRAFKIDAPVEAITTEHSASNINRPRYSVLQNTLLRTHGITLPSWQDALARMSKET
jgi:dTDP-4-dehydrorhamnose reductase